MPVETMTAEQELLAEVRARRGLPPASERRRIRKQAGVSLRQLGMVIGVSHVAITRWEAGAQPARPEHVAAYARLLTELDRG